MRRRTSRQAILSLRAEGIEITLEVTPRVAAQSSRGSRPMANLFFSFSFDPAARTNIMGTRQGIAVCGDEDIRDSRMFRLPASRLSVKAYHSLHLHLTANNKEESNGCFIQTLVNRHGKRNADKRLASFILWRTRPLTKNNVDTNLCQCSVGSVPWTQQPRHSRETEWATARPEV